jgi:hypothetical protein
VEIRFLYSEDCPSHDEALRRVRQALAEEGIRASVEVIRVDTEEQAVKLKFSGSPTIYVDDRDIDPPTEPRYALSCRAYRLEDGRISPLPSLPMIHRALKFAKARSALK